MTTAPTLALLLATGTVGLLLAAWWGTRERVWRCGRCRARFTVHPQITTAEARAAHLAVGCRQSHPAVGGGR
jgi:hypothetical protein